MRSLAPWHARSLRGIDLQFVRSLLAPTHLLSWGRPFGRALKEIAPGEYVCNRRVLGIFAERGIAGSPFARVREFRRTRSSPSTLMRLRRFRPPRSSRRRMRTNAHSSGFPRTPIRGWGTRNYIIVLGVTSRASSFVNELAERLKSLARVFPALDGVVAVAHTEGDGREMPNNRDEVLRTLAGFHGQSERQGRSLRWSTTALRPSTEGS